MKISLLASRGVFHSELLILSNGLDILFRFTKFRPTMEDTNSRQLFWRRGLFTREKI
jgi:hypothetical protein